MEEAQSTTTGKELRHYQEFVKTVAVNKRRSENIIRRSKKYKRKQELRTTDVMRRKDVHTDYIHVSKGEDVQRFDRVLLRHAAENDTDKTTGNVECNIENIAALKYC